MPDSTTGGVDLCLEYDGPMDLVSETTSRRQEYIDLFRTATLEFGELCDEICYRRCDICQMVSMQNIFKCDTLCKGCSNGSAWTRSPTELLPIWTNDAGLAQFHVPDELSCLREGEKLLIQQISVYVPLHHLKYGQLGAQGHIVSFPQDVADVCLELPRLPSNVSLVRVIKHFKLENEEIASKSFSIRRRVVLDALLWLKKYNKHYRHIEIIESNIDWIENGLEQQLPPSVLQTTIDPCILQANNEDRGPSEEQIAAITDLDPMHETCYGTVSEFNEHNPKVKDNSVVEAIAQAEQTGKAVATAGKRTRSIDFPFVSCDPICEYTERFLFEKAFPCLFPGGTGGYGSIKEPKPKLNEWMMKTMLYKDGRFATDKMWAFCALNFAARHTNQTSGGFFVDTFFKQGPQTLDVLKEKLAEGDLSWLHSISYFSHRVTGSSAYWRARRSDVFSWINYHLEQKHGPPSFFITLSCAEYHWKDIERLITDRCIKGEVSPPDFSKGRAGIINDYSIVVQEYFQMRVQAWLDTVGKRLLKIKHHWLRFEFAPSRGQIHAHMLAICDNLEVQRACFDLKHDKDKLAGYLASWMEDTLGMTASFNSKFVDELRGTAGSDHPSTVNFADVVGDDWNQDLASCQARFQKHRCSSYCMRKRQNTQAGESAESKLRRVCRCGAGVEQTFLKNDTPGFTLSQKAVIMRDIRGFDRVDLVRNTRRITQASAFLMQGWRGNSDIQYLIYKSLPDDVDPEDVSRVTNYIVSYACKGSETVVEEKKAMIAIINAAKEEQGDKRDMKRLARRLLNQCSKNRVVSKQEAVCQLVGLPLFSCSETLENVSLAGNVKLGSEGEGRTTLLTKYARRAPSLHHMSLDAFFHHENARFMKDGVKKKIPKYSGAQCEAVYPATPAYARGVMLIYCPWHGTFDLDKQNTSLLDAFHAFISNHDLCPESVSVSYHRAKISVGMKETTTSQNDVDYDTFSIRPERIDQEIVDLVDLASSIYNKAGDTGDSDGMNYDYGEDRDWSERSIEVSPSCHSFEAIYYLCSILLL